MAATFIAIEEAESGSGNTTSTAAMNISTGDFVYALTGSTVPTTAVSVDGQAMTLIRRVTIAAPSAFSFECWYLQNAVADASAVVTSTHTSGNFCVLVVAQYSGVETTGAFDQSASNTATDNALTDSINWTSQNVTTTSANELLIYGAIGWDVHTTHTAQAGWTKRTAAGTKSFVVADRSVTATGSHPAGTVIAVSDGADDRYAGFIATFLEPGGGAEDDPTGNWMPFTMVSGRPTIRMVESGMKPSGA
jgi:hypothetical protein